MFMLLLLKDLLIEFIISCKIKDQRATWLCLVEDNLSSLHDIPSTDLASNLSRFLPFFRIKHLHPNTWK
jgi:hypothetical protein